MSWLVGLESRVLLDCESSRLDLPPSASSCGLGSYLYALYAAIRIMLMVSNDIMKHRQQASSVM